MNLNELTTLASYDLPIAVFVMNNTVLGMVRQWQKVFYNSRFSATDPHRKTDFVKLAEAFGCTGMRISKNSEVEPVIKAALELNRPVVDAGYRLRQCSADDTARRHRENHKEI